ncbi:MAG: aminopeptidase [Candidatus Bathyarchaeota archaeon]|nr:aminopeptidase [Candidatus Bathyarchaeota archaeon]
MPQYYEYELGKAAHKLVSEMYKLKPGETFVITADTESDPRVVDATAAAAFAVGAKPMVIWTASPLGVGKAADPMLPVEALTAVLNVADAWAEFNNEWLLYSTPYEVAMKQNKKIRHLCLVGMNVNMMTRVIGRVDLPTLADYQNKLIAMTKAAKHIRMTTPAGEDVEFDNDLKRPIICEVGYADTPGSHMLGGQIGWAPIFKSINGTIAFNGSIVPPIGLVKEPVKLHVREGKVVKVEGGEDARAFESWLKSFNDPLMLRMAHVCYGCNPGAKLTGDIVEDERVWGCTEWGLGYVGPMLTGGEPIPAPSHTDGICLNTSVWLDGEQIWNKGRAVHPELAELAKKLGKV